MRLFQPTFGRSLCFVAIFLNLIMQGESAKRNVTVRDAIEMTRISDSSLPEVARFSANGTRFAVILKKGNIKWNTNDDRLEIFNTHTAFRSQKPEAVIRMSSASNREAIRGVKWLKDNRTLLFLGETPKTLPQIYSYDVERRLLRRITRNATPIVAFDSSADGNTIVFEADPPAQDGMNTPEVRRAGFHVTAEDLRDVLLAGSPYAQYRSRESRQLFLMSRGGKARRIPVADGIWPNLTLSVSPNGRYALVEAFTRDIPQSWEGYKDKFLHEFIVAPKATSAFSSVERYLLLDTGSGKIAPLINAPKSWEHDGFFWMHGGQSILLSKAYLPLAGVEDMKRNQREGNTFAVEIFLPSRRIIPILTGDAIASDWIPEADEAIFRESGAKENLTYRKQGSVWQNVSGEAREPRFRHARVSYEQDMNTPPKLWITDETGRNKTLLLDLNPQFQRLCFGREQTIFWRATDGHPVRGGLYFPPNYQPGHRYPLVIQTHAFDPTQFWMDGPWSSAYAAQPLASKGIVVLQMGGSSDSSDTAYRSTPEEALRQMAAFEGAIDHLDREGIIDRNRVGILGFSRTVYHVAYTLTHSKYPFRAAVLADGFNGGYFERIAYPNQAAEPNAVNGGPPYGDGLSLWLRSSPEFNIPNLKTPVRLEGYGVAAAIEEWEWYSLSLALKKPVEFVIFPRAAHMLVKPWERMASQQGTIDWFTRWLKGELEHP